MKKAATTPAPAEKQTNIEKVETLLQKIKVLEKGIKFAEIATESAKKLISKYADEISKLLKR